MSCFHNLRKVRTNPSPLGDENFTLTVIGIKWTLNQPIPTRGRKCHSSFFGEVIFRNQPNPKRGRKQFKVFAVLTVFLTNQPNPTRGRKKAIFWNRSGLNPVNQPIPKRGRKYFERIICFKTIVRTNPSPSGDENLFLSSRYD